MQPSHIPHPGLHQHPSRWDGVQRSIPCWRMFRPNKVQPINNVTVGFPPRGGGLLGRAEGPLIGGRADTTTLKKSLTPQSICYFWDRCIGRPAARQRRGRGWRAPARALPSCNYRMSQGLVFRNLVAQPSRGDPRKALMCSRQPTHRPPIEGRPRARTASPTSP